MLLEICTGSVDDCVAAEAGGADRVELNAALSVGGLTPSPGLFLEARARVGVPIIGMVRPRPGGFCYSPADFDVMQQDAGWMLDRGADGIAFGVLHEDGAVDVERCAALVRLIGQSEAVFHRAFDVTPDPFAALDQLIDLGVTRVMTSGQEASAYDGAALIARLIEHAAGRIDVLPAGGINRFTVADVVARTGCTQVHASVSTTKPDPSTRARPQVAFGGAVRAPEDQFRTTDPGAVTALRQMLDQLGIEE